MSAVEPRLAELKRLLGAIDDVRRASWLLHWDLETMMPPAGAAARAEQLGTLAGIAHERFVADELGVLLEELTPLERELPYDSDDASLIRVCRRDYERARRVPAELTAELVRTGAHGGQTWRRARAENDYAVFCPALERNLELQARYIECLDGGAGDPYDVLVAEHEPGLTTADIISVFDRLREELRPLVAGIEPPDEPVPGLGWSDGERRDQVARLLGKLGFEREWGRIDHSVHPFMINFSTGDIRLTIYEGGDLRALYAGLHEFGHGLYERNVDAGLGRSPLAFGASSALHESQSLLWENLVGRGRPFCSWYARELGRDPEWLFRTANRVERSLIRVDADPVTYSLHIVFRFELEHDLVTGRLAAADLSDAWNEHVAEYLGISVPDDLRGVLQDMHWADSLMGYFPSYALGHVASAQIWERATADLPQLDDDTARGEFGPLREWLREHVHRHGRKFTTPETLERAIGGGLDPEPLLRYVRGKVEAFD